MKILSGQFLQASGDPFFGYSNTNWYFLDYVVGTSFAPGGTSDVQIHAKIGTESLIFNVDTGSRGLYASSTALGINFVISPDAYPGQIELDSSGRLSSGWWTPTTVSFEVKDQGGFSQHVTSTPNILDVTTLSAQSNRTAFFGVETNVPGYNGTVTLDGGGTVPVEFVAGKYGVTLTNNGVINQKISYATNIPGLIKDVSNFGIGFDLSGAPGGTGPVTNNMNQIYNPLLNLSEMTDGTLVAGYIIRTNGIQLGLSTEDKGFAYTTLNPTIFSSTNSVPDWQTPMGQTTIHGTTNGPGSIVMDSGIGEAFLSAAGLTVGDYISDRMSVSLMNSGGAAGYYIDLNDTNNVLNPTSVEIVSPATNGIYSQNQPPFQSDFFNTGRNVFVAFDMLYDAENGYMGVLTNHYGATDTNIFFTAQAGGFPNPVPEGSSVAMVFMGLILVLQTTGIFQVLRKKVKSK